MVATPYLPYRARWNRVSLRQGAHQALQGVGLGTAAFLAWLAIAKAKKWVSAPAWGWEQTSMNEVVRSATLLGIGHLAVSWNEEMVFRGYGFETVREALGQGKAMAVLIPGFALYHGLDPQQVPGMLADGATLMLLRLHTDALWMPAIIGPGMCSRLRSLARQTPRPPSGRWRCMVLNAGWVDRVPQNQDC